jgi:RHS repeat-associated protein
MRTRFHNPLSIVIIAVLSQLPTLTRARAQDYFSQGGKPTSATVDPVDSGFINIANGNLHLQVGLPAASQRGSYKSPPFIYTYDGNPGWVITPGGSGGTCGGPCPPSWQATGGGNGVAFGWSQAQVALSLNNLSCPNGVCGTYVQDFEGTKRFFPETSACNNTFVYATDSSGYALACDTVFPGGTRILNSWVFDPDGTDLIAYCTQLGQPVTGLCNPNGGGPAIEAFIQDRNGNYWGSDSFGNGSVGLTDTVGRPVSANPFSVPTVFVPTASSQNLAVHPSVAFANITLKTNFGQPGVTEFSGQATVIQSISLPDGSSYTFKYDCDSGTGNTACGSPAGQSGYYGLLTSMTLPTGGTVSFGYTAFTDAYGKKRRWLTSRTSSNGTYTYSPTVLSTSTCSTTQTGCQQEVAVTNPDGSTRTYVYAMNNGAWPVQEQFHDKLGNLVSSVTNMFDFSNPCPFSSCGGASYIRLLTTQTSIPGPSGTLTRQTKYTYDSPQLGDVTGVQVWGFQPGASPSFAQVPDRATYTPYEILGNNIHRPQSVTVCNNSGSDSACPGGGSKASQTLYTYDNYAASCPGGGLASVTGVTNSNGPIIIPSNPQRNGRGNITSTGNLVTGTTYATTQLCYDTTGQVTAVTDPNGNTTSFSYKDNFFKDASPASNPPSAANPSTPTNGYPTQITLPLIGSVSLGYYYGSGKLASSVDQNSADSYFHYLDPLDRQTHTFSPITNGSRSWSLATYAAGGTQTDSYSAITDTTPSTSCIGCTHTRQTFDTFGRPMQTTLVNDPDGASSASVTYDILGRLQTATNPFRSTTDPTYGVTAMSYDSLSRPTTLTEADGSKVNVYYGASVVNAGGASAQLCSPATYHYGYPILVVDEAGKKRQSWRDAFGNTIEVDEPNSSGALTLGTCYAYDVRGNLTGVTQMGGSTSTQWRVRTFAYDGLSRLTSATEPESGTTTYTYDLNSNLLTKTSPTVPITYTYDALNRLTSKSYSGNTMLTVAYGYDGASISSSSPCTLPTLTITNGLGRRTGMCDAAGSEAWSYDGLGRVTADVRTINGFLGTKNTFYAYNLDGSVSSLTYPSGRTVTYAPGVTGPLSAIDSANSITYATGAHYSPAGALSSLTNGTGLVSTFFYNSRLQPCRITALSTGTSPTSCTDSTHIGNILDYTFNFSPGANNGNITAIANNRDSTRSQTFLYDALNRLSTARTQSTTGTNAWGLQFGYDSWGNLLSQNVTQGTAPPNFNLTVGANNQISGFCYGASGNLLDQTSCPTGINPHTFGYSSEGQIISAGTNPTNLYTYDGDGRRLIKEQKVIVAGRRELRITKIFWYGSGSTPLHETDAPATTAFNEYVFFNGQRIARVDASNNVDYYFADHLGTARVVTNSTGTILDDSDFYPFGGERPVSSSSGNTYKFTGYERDSETGLDYAGARHYASTLGRFMSPDPLSGSPGNPQSWNRYSYVLNNPLNATDPSGLCPDENGNDDGSPCPGDGGGSISFGGFDPSNGAPLFDISASAFSPYLSIYSSPGDLLTDPLTGQYAPVPGGPYEADGSILSLIANGGYATPLTAAANVLNDPRTYVSFYGASILGGALAVQGGLLEGAELLCASRGGQCPALLGNLAEEEIQFAQQGISATFRNGPFAGRAIDDVAAGLRAGDISPNELPIQTITRGGIRYTLNNRSLMALREAGLKPTNVIDVTGNAGFEKLLTQRLAELAGRASSRFVPYVRNPLP